MSSLDPTTYLSLLAYVNMLGIHQEINPLTRSEPLGFNPLWQHLHRHTQQCASWIAGAQQTQTGSQDESSQLSSFQQKDLYSVTIPKFLFLHFPTAIDPSIQLAWKATKSNIGWVKNCLSWLSESALYLFLFALCCCDKHQDHDGRMLTYIFNSSTHKAEASGSLSSRLALPINRVPRQPGQHRETLS